jgi:hypothetical protein
MSSSDRLITEQEKAERRFERKLRQDLEFELRFSAYEWRLAEAFDRAFEFFNRELFAGCLPLVSVGLDREDNDDSTAYFLSARFSGKHYHQLMFNPERLIGEGEEKILSILVHEMAHLWQEVHGKCKSTPGCHHNREWKRKMRELGLEPIVLAGDVIHRIAPDGPYSKAYAKLRNTDFRLPL